MYLSNIVNIQTFQSIKIKEKPYDSIKNYLKNIARNLTYCNTHQNRSNSAQHYNDGCSPNCNEKNIFI